MAITPNQYATPLFFIRMSRVKNFILNYRLGHVFKKANVFEIY
jgi:hypothetical protein